MSRIKVYTASCLNQAALWRDLVKTWPEIEWTARWPHSHIIGEVQGLCPAHASVFWEQDYDDVERSNVVLVYGAHDDSRHLRGALVEAGMGIALGKTVIVVGDHVSYSTWQFHPQVKRVRHLNDARSLLALLSGHKPPPVLCSIATRPAVSPERNAPA